MRKWEWGRGDGFRLGSRNDGERGYKEKLNLYLSFFAVGVVEDEITASIAWAIAFPSYH